MYHVYIFGSPEQRAAFEKEGSLMGRLALADIIVKTDSKPNVIKNRWSDRVIHIEEVQS